MSVWLVSTDCFAPLLAFHKRMVLSSEAEASRYPFWEKATPRTSSPWPDSVISSFACEALPEVIPTSDGAGVRVGLGVWVGVGVRLGVRLGVGVRVCVAVLDGVNVGSVPEA